MIHATTHTGAERVLDDRAIPIRRIGPRAFAALVGVELLVLVAVLIWALTALVPQATPLATSAHLAPIEDAIRARMSGAVDDPLVTVAGKSARSSNVRGFSLAGQTYYYYVEGAENFDPLSRGAVNRSDVEVLLRDDSGQRAFVVYRIL